MGTEKKLTGYPSIDKPWLKYYSEEAVQAQMPTCSMYEYIFRSNRDHPENIALSYYGNRITYGTLFANIDRAAIGFRAMGVKAGDVVSLMSIVTPELLYCVYGLNKIGAVSNMLDPRSSEETLIKQITLAESRLLVVLDACADKVDALSKKIHLEHSILLTLKESMGFPIKQIYGLKTALNPKPDFPFVDWKTFLANVTRDDISCKSDVANTAAMIYYTGGTTGESKGVLLSNQNINSVVEQYRNIAKGHDRQQTWLALSVPFIAYAFICGFHLPLACGMVCFPEMYEPQTLAEKIVRHKYHHAAVTPIVWESIIKLPDAQKVDFSFLIAPVTGGDAMSHKLEEEINMFFSTHNCNWKICQGYGMTEVSSGVSLSFSNDCYKPGSVGIPFSHTVISAFDVDTCTEMKVGKVGEICITGPSVMLGYFKNPKATAEMIKQHPDGKMWLHTGDLGRIDEDGSLFIVGRIKRMIAKYDGFKVFPAAVEEKILTHPAVEKCCVVGKHDPRGQGGQLPVAFVVLAEGYTNQALPEIKAHCENVLPEYSRPVDFFVKDEFPLTAANKTDYRALEKEVEK